MKTLAHDDTTKRQITWVLAVTTVLLVVPLVAMQFSTEVVWSLGDFVTAAGLLLGIGMVYVLIVKRARGIKQRLGLGLLLTIILLLVWIELAVGVVGSPFAGS